MQQQFQGYTEKEVLKDALTMQKNQTGLFNNYSNECANPNVRKIMLDILDDEHAIQFDVFNDMHSRGYYPTNPAQQNMVNQVKTTYEKCVKQTEGAGTNTGAWHTQDNQNKPMM